MFTKIIIVHLNLLYVVKEQQHIEAQYYFPKPLDEPPDLVAHHLLYKGWV